MAHLLACAQLGQDVIYHGVLGGDEAIRIEAIRFQFQGCEFLAKLIDFRGPSHLVGVFSLRITARTSAEDRI